MGNRGSPTTVYPIHSGCGLNSMFLFFDTITRSRRPLPNHHQVAFLDLSRSLVRRFQALSRWTHLVQVDAFWSMDPGRKRKAISVTDFRERFNKVTVVAWLDDIRPWHCHFIHRTLNCHQGAPIRCILVSFEGLVFLDQANHWIDCQNKSRFHQSSVFYLPIFYQRISFLRRK